MCKDFPEVKEDMISPKKIINSWFMRVFYSINLLVIILAYKVIPIIRESFLSYNSVLRVIFSLSYLVSTHNPN